MAWVYLLIASALEVVWATGLKASEGFTKLGVSLVTVAAMIATYIFLALALKTLPLGVAYTIWTGIGAVGSVVVGIFVYNESRDALKLLCVALIVAGIVGLKFSTPTEKAGPEDHTEREIPPA